MAEKKKSSSSGRNTTKVPAAKRQSTKKSTGGSEKRMSAEAMRQRNQIKAVVLFACAVFLGCLVLISGDNLWLWAHNIVLGLFGGWTFLWPLLMAYVAIITALEKPNGSIGAKVWLTAIVIVLCCTAGYIFSAELPNADTKLSVFIASLYNENTGVGGGVFGGMLGLPLLRATGEIGAKIIVMLLLFVAVMILTGTTLISLFKAVKKPVDVVSGGIQSAKQRRDERRERENVHIDIPLEAEMPAHPVIAEASSVFSKPEPKKKKKEKNEKLERLNEVFGIEKSEEPVLSESVNAPLAASEENLSEEHAALTEAALAGENESIAVNEILNRSEEPKKNAKEDDKAEIYIPTESIERQLSYCFPPVTMLSVSNHMDPAKETEELQSNGQILVDTLKSFGVQTKIVNICRGPAVTRYEIQPAAGVKISKITSLSDDLALNLAATGVRIEAPIPGKAAVGIEVPNRSRNVVRMRDLIESNAFQTAKSKLSAALGRDIAGQPVVTDLTKMPHLLIAGTTGSGKSVCINSIIISVLYKAAPDEVRFLMIDPKAVELTDYNGMPHMLVPVVTDPRKASGALSWAVSEMMNRYKIFSEFNVRNIDGYNSLAKSRDFLDENGQPMPAMPKILIVIDELADLMMAAPKEVEDSICRLAQLARAAGMHLIVATQRPSVDVVTGLIKANIPSRIALTVSNAVDSRTILDSGGAEKLLGNGDMLFAPVSANKPIRVQGCYVSDDEIASVVEFVKSTKSIEYDENVMQEIEKNAAGDGDKNSSAEKSSSDMDPMMDEAIKCVVEAGQASTSLLQRRLRLGYARAGRLIDEMEQLGVVGPHEGSKPRQVLMSYSQWMEMNMLKSDSAKKGESTGNDKQE